MYQYKALRDGEDELEDNMFSISVHDHRTTGTVSTVLRNTTEDIVYETGGVDTLIIIIWCFGGLLLIILFFLLSQILRAKKNNNSDDPFDYNEHFVDTGGNSLFRIRVDGTGQASALPQSRDTIDLVPESDSFPMDSPAQGRTRREISSITTCQRNPSASAEILHQNEQTRTNTCRSQLGVHNNVCLNDPSLRSAHNLGAHDTGSRTTRNGFTSENHRQRGYMCF